MNKSKYIKSTHSKPCMGQLRRTCMETLNLLIASTVSRYLTLHAVLFHAIVYFLFASKFCFIFNPLEYVVHLGGLYEFINPVEDIRDILCTLRLVKRMYTKIPGRASFAIFRNYKGHPCIFKSFLSNQE